jgi:hypothetical protein
MAEELSWTESWAAQRQVGILVDSEEARASQGEIAEMRNLLESSKSRFRRSKMLKQH